MYLSACALSQNVSRRLSYQKEIYTYTAKIYPVENNIPNNIQAITKTRASLANSKSLLDLIKLIICPVLFLNKKTKKADKPTLGM